MATSASGAVGVNTSSSVIGAVPCVQLRTPENRKNGLNLQLILDRSLLLQLDIFHQYFPRDPKELNKEMKKRRTKIKKLRSDGEINPRQYFMLLPKDTNETSSDEFDSTILHKLLSIFCNLPTPKKGWKSMPDDTDRSREANLVRLNISRNDIQHGTLTVTDEKYKTISDVALQAMIELGVDKEELENLCHHTKYNVYPPIWNFTSRDEEIHNIQSMVENSNNNMMRIVVHGLAGVGKSELIREYCKRYDVYYNSNILWINAETESSLVASFRSIAEMIGLTIKDLNGNYKGQETIIYDVHKYLINEKVLYVFNDVENSIESYLPRYKPSYTIITSQVTTWSKEYQTLNLQEFNIDKSNEFLTETITKAITNNQIETILKIADGHPLALQQISAFINKTTMDIGKYIQILKEETSKTLSKAVTHNNKMKQISVMAIINVTLDRLEHHSNHSVANEIINIAAHLDGNNINLNFLTRIITDQNEIDIDMGVTLLEKYSLVKIHKCNGEANIVVHSLVQQAVLLNQDLKETSSYYREKVINSFFENVSDEKCVHANFGKEWMDHFMYLYKKIDQNILLLSKSKKNKPFLFKIFQSKGRLNDLIPVLQSLDKCDKNGEDCSEDQLNTKYYIAFCLQSLGQYKEALTLYRLVDKSQTRILGPEHTDTLTTKNNLALCLKLLGQYKKAFTLYKSVIEYRTRILGPEHPKTLASKNNLASCLRSLGQYENAFTLYRSVIESRTRILGPEHPDTLTPKNNLALCLELLGQYKKAFTLYKSVIESRTRILGPEHPKTLVSKNNLASCLESLGQAKEALTLYILVDESRTRILGPEHPDTIATKNNLALCLASLKQFDEALVLYRLVDESNTRILGLEHPRTLTTKNNLASCLESLGQYKEAFTLYKSVIESRTRILGPEHPKTLDTKNNLALLLQSLGQYEEALTLYTLVNKSQTRILGPEHTKTIATKNNLCYVMLCLAFKNKVTRRVLFNL